MQSKQDYASALIHEAAVYDANAGDVAPSIDFLAPADIVSVVVEGERLTYGHLFNPTFATEISLIELYRFILRSVIPIGLPTISGRGKVSCNASRSAFSLPLGERIWRFERLNQVEMLQIIVFKISLLIAFGKSGSEVEDFLYIV